MKSSSLPNFFIVGVAKAGTTSIARYLDQHPDVFVSKVKEPKYFSVPDNVFPHKGPQDELADKKVVRDFDRYQDLFRPGSHCRARGEASVDYLYFRNSASRIRKIIPDAKIIAILRNPADRAFSAYMHNVRDGIETLPFDEAIRAEAGRIKENWEFFWHYTELGFYSKQIEHYIEVFGKNNVFALLYDDFVSDPAEFCKTVFGILEVDTSFHPDISHKYNVSGRPRSRMLHDLFNRKNIVKSIFKPFLPKSIRKKINKRLAGINLGKEEMNSETRQMLQCLYREDILRLETVIGRDLRHWIREE